MEFRHLGRSGLKITEITYGNWLTHGSQVENDVANACVRAALDAGITSFDTADVYAERRRRDRARRGADRASAGKAWRSSRRSTGPPGRGPNDSGLSRKHVMESINALAAPAADRLRRPLPGPPLRHRDAARGDDAGVRRRRARGQGALHRRQRVDGRADPGRPRPRRRLGIQLVSNQPQYSMLWRVIEGEVVPTSRSWHLPDRVLADRAGRADRQVPARRRRPRARGPRTRRAAPPHQPVHDRRVAHPGAAAGADRRGAGAVPWPSSPWPGCCRTRTSPPRSSAPRRPEQVHENVKAAGVRARAELLARIDEVLGDVVERDPAPHRAERAADPADLSSGARDVEHHEGHDCCSRTRFRPS